MSSGRRGFSALGTGTNPGHPKSATLFVRLTKIPDISHYREFGKDTRARHVLWELQDLRNRVSLALIGELSLVASNITLVLRI